MSSNSLFDLFIWIHQSAKKFTSENVFDLIINAPQYYDVWWRNLLKEAPEHILIETGLILFIIWLVFIRRTVDPSKIAKNERLSEKEMNWLLETWKPEALVPAMSVIDEKINSNIMTINEIDGNLLSIEGIAQPVLNVASFDFLSFSQNSDIKKKAKDALDFYGCGSCGPRGFYGTIDQHLFFEEAIAKFMGAQEAICYSDGASAVSSAIPAFSKKGDLLLVDEACSEPILTGCNLSRSTVQFFKHNDMQDLRNILESIADDDQRLKRDTLQQRRFIVVEGLYRNTGDVCPLSEIMRLKEEFCYRLILDETLSFGTMGSTGRGITEHFGLNRSDVEIILLTLDTTLASVGGVCLGTREIVDHQRLSGAGYCFSASAPPFLSAAATEALGLMERNPSLLVDLHRNASFLFEKLKKVKHLRVQSPTATPVLSLVLHPAPVPGSAEEERESDLLLRIAHECAQRGVGICASRFALSKRAASKVRPCLMLCASNSLTEKQMMKIISVLSDAVSVCLKK